MIDPNLILETAFDGMHDWYSLVDEIGHEEAQQYMKHYDGLVFWGNDAMAGVEYGDTAVLLTLISGYCFYNMRLRVDNAIKRLGINNARTAHIKGTMVLAIVAINGERFK